MMVENVTSSTSSNLVPTSSMDDVAKPLSNLVPYFPRRGRVDEVRGGLGTLTKNTPETVSEWTRFDCVRCGVYVGPDLMLCPTCYAATRTGRRLAGTCPSCGGRLADGKCGWC